MYAVLGVAGYLLVTEPKELKSKSDDKPVQAVGLDVKAALMTKQFYILW